MLDTLQEPPLVLQCSSTQTDWPDCSTHSSRPLQLAELVSLQVLLGGLHTVRSDHGSSYQSDDIHANPLFLPEPTKDWKCLACFKLQHTLPRVLTVTTLELVGLDRCKNTLVSIKASCPTSLIPATYRHRNPLTRLIHCTELYCALHHIKSRRQYL